MQHPADCERPRSGPNALRDNNNFFIFHNLICNIKRIIFILLFPLSFSYSQWITIANLNSRLLSDIEVINQVIYTGGDSVKIFKSTDFGSSWNLVHPPISNGISAISFINGLTGYAAGSGVYKTTDGGLSWIASNWSFDDIEFLNELTGYAVEDLNKDIYKTTNGGQSYISYLTLAIYPKAIDMLNVNTGWVVGEKDGPINVCYKTTNAGFNWFLYSILSPPPREAVSFYDSSFGVAVGWTDHFSISTNGGINWSMNFIGIPGNYSDVQCITRNTIYAVGNFGIIVKSTDGGVSWFQQSSGTSQHLTAVRFVNELTGFACGFNGLVLKTTNGGTIGVTPIGNSVPKTYNLYQNYPNPFNPVTKIRFDIPVNSKIQMSNIRLTLFDVLGREIVKLADEQLNPGTYEVEWNAANYPSGVYFYRIEAAEFVDAKKMVLIK
jgi:photosystem II stability/assembly factor-like uncharacterized protein